MTEREEEAEIVSIEELIKNLTMKAAGLRLDFYHKYGYAAGKPKENV